MWMGPISPLAIKLVAFGEVAFIQVSKGISPRCMIYYRGQMIMSLRSAPPLEGLRDYSFDQSVMLLSRIGAMSGEGQNEQVPPYSMCIRTAFVVCIRRGEITGAASRGKQPDRSSEDELDPCRCFWNNRADRLFLRSQPRLLG